MLLQTNCQAELTENPSESASGIAAPSTSIQQPESSAKSFVDHTLTRRSAGRAMVVHLEIELRPGATIPQAPIKRNLPNLDTGTNSGNGLQLSCEPPSADGRILV